MTAEPPHAAGREPSRGVGRPDGEALPPEARASVRITSRDLAGKIIDMHAHLGLSLKAYARGEYPYCQSIEGLFYRQQANGVECGVVFPFAPELFFDLPTLMEEGRMVPSARPPGPAPYALENRMVFSEVHRFHPGHRGRFLPFVSVDPGRAVHAQLDALRALAAEHPVYGMKINPVLCQSPVTGLLEEGEVFMDFARERDLPLLFHVTVDPDEEYSQVSDTLRVIERHPGLRFCLAHCAGFSREHLERAGDAANVWVDTSALKIQVRAAHENLSFMAPPGKRFDWDYSDHLTVMRELAARFPDTIVWGSDSPAYTYIARRLQGAGTWRDFALQGTYEDEKAALDALPPGLRDRVGSTNGRAFLFGKNTV